MPRKKRGANWTNKKGRDAKRRVKKKIPYIGAAKNATSVVQLETLIKTEEMDVTENEPYISAEELYRLPSQESTVQVKVEVDETAEEFLIVPGQEERKFEIKFGEVDETAEDLLKLQDQEAPAVQVKVEAVDEPEVPYIDSDEETVLVNIDSDQCSKEIKVNEHVAAIMDCQKKDIEALKKANIYLQNKLYHIQEKIFDLHKKGLITQEVKNILLKNTRVPKT